MGGLNKGGKIAQIVGAVLLVVGTIFGGPAGAVGWAAIMNTVGTVGMVLTVAGSIAVAIDPLEMDPEEVKRKGAPGFQAPYNLVGGDAVIPVAYGLPEVRPVIAQAFITPLDKHNDAITEESGIEVAKHQGMSLQCIVSEGPIESIESIQINDQELWEDVDGEVMGTGDGTMKAFRFTRKFLKIPSLVIYVNGVQKTHVTGQSEAFLQIGKGNGNKKNFDFKLDDKKAVIDMDSVVAYYDYDAPPDTQSYKVKSDKAWKLEIRFDKKVPDGQKVRISFDFITTGTDEVTIVGDGNWTYAIFKTAPTSGHKITFDGSVSNYPDVIVEPFLGAVNQPPVEGANQVRNSYQVGDQLLEAQPVSYTTVSEVDDVSVAIGALQGMIRMKKDGNTVHRSAKIAIDYRQAGASRWIALVNPQTENDPSTLHYVGGVVFKLGPDAIGDTEFRLKGQRLNPKRWELSIKETIKRAVEKGRMDEDALVNFARGKYEVRVTRTNQVGAEGGDSGVRDRIWFTHVTELQEEKLSYPGSAGFWLHAVASARLQGRLPRVSCTVKGRKVKNLDTGVTEWSRNPAWCTADMLTSTRYGGGVAEADLLSSWVTWGAWNDEAVTLEDGTTEARCQMDVVLDVARPPLQWAKDLMASHFAIPVLQGKRWGVFIDRARATDKTYEYTGATANQELNSIAVRMESRSKTPTEIDVTFIDRDNDYEIETILIVPSTRTDERMKRSLLLPGITRRTQAIRVGNHILRSAQDQPIICEFTAMPDGALNEVGDVILVKSDVGDWSEGKLFRVLRVGFDSKLRVSLLCREYNANLYSASSSELPSGKAEIAVNTKPTAVGFPVYATRGPGSMSIKGKSPTLEVTELTGEVP